MMKFTCYCEECFDTVVIPYQDQADLLYLEEAAGTGAIRCEACS